MILSIFLDRAYPTVRVSVAVIPGREFQRSASLYLLFYVVYVRGENARPFDALQLRGFAARNRNSTEMPDCKRRNGSPARRSPQLRFAVLNVNNVGNSRPPTIAGHFYILNAFLQGKISFQFH